MKIWRNAPNFNPDRSSPISWMSVIVRNTAIDALRLKTLPTTDLDSRCRYRSRVPDGADDFDYDHARPIAATAIRQLPDDRQATAVARLYRRRKPPIAVEAFGVPVGTIKTWLRRTLETVRTDCAALRPGGELIDPPAIAPN